MRRKVSLEFMTMSPPQFICSFFFSRIESSKDDRSTQKTPVQTRPLRVIWTNIERNLFFEALNEYGKDFEAISHYVNAKQRRKSTTDPTYKTKDHVRFIYYQTFHKVIKYLRFSDGKFECSSPFEIRSVLIFIFRCSFRLLQT